MAGAAGGVARAARGRRQRAVLAFAAGLLIATGQAPLSWAWPALAGLVALFFLVVRAEGPLPAALAAWAGGAGYFGGGLFWIVEPFFVDPVRHGWMAPFALVLLPGGLALFWGLAAALSARLAHGWARPFLLAALLAGVEASRAVVLTGFPWALVGYLWIGHPQAQAASVIGPHGLTLGTTLVAALAVVWVGRGRGWLVAPALAAALVVGAGLWGQARLAAPLPEPPGVTLRLVQPNAQQGLKWDAEMAAVFLERLLALTAEPPEGPAPDAVIWPETAVPYLLNGSEDLLEEMHRTAGEVPVVFGIVRRDGARVFNSLAVTGPGGTVAALYDKHHLTPFGEYVPFGELLGRFGIHGLAASEGAAFTPGPGPQLVSIEGAGTALPLICYEAIFPQNLRGAGRPGWIVQITNDAWFGEVSGPYQHLDQARMRALEQGLPLVRVANTGVSAVIDAKGRVTASLALGIEGRIDVALPAALAPTAYARLGDWPALAAMVLLALGVAAIGPRKSD